MGQYYKFVNLDKKQICERNRYGYKLTEHSYYDSYYCMDILTLLSNEWKGDRIIHVGDYADVSDGTNTENIIGNIINEFKIKSSVYDWAGAQEDVSPDEMNLNIRYVYNHDKKEYVDLLKQPIQWFYDNGEEIHGVKFNAFALLIGCGNEQGGGDYRCINKEQIGSWAGDRFESSVIFLDKYKDYKENNYIYDEKSYDVGNTWDSKSEKIILNKESDLLKKYFENYKKNCNKDLDIFVLSSTELLPIEIECLNNTLRIIKNDVKSKDDINL